MSRKRAWLYLFLLCLVVLNGATYYALHEARSERLLRVSFLNIGQGDSVLIQSPGGGEMLIDGGPDRSVLRELPRVLGPLDRSLDLVVETHPDKDHIAGLTDVLKRYKVAAFMEPGIPNDTSFSQSLLAAVGAEEGIVSLHARRGMRIHLGGGAYADVLYPDRDVPGVETNMGSIVLRVVYGQTEFMLTGDAPTNVENWLVSLDGESLQSDVLKAGHHGSRTSTSQAWIDAVDPDYVVISAGRGNSYGHPHEETVSRVASSGALMLSTMGGTVSFVSDGKTVEVAH